MRNPIVTFPCRVNTPKPKKALINSNPKIKQNPKPNIKSSIASSKREKKQVLTIERHNQNQKAKRTRNPPKDQTQTEVIITKGK